MRLLAVSGSLQERSSNQALLRVAFDFVPPGTTLVRAPDLASIPALNPDLESDGRVAPASVREFRAAVGGADGVLIATPEYGHSMPGFLKNALDWLVGSGELSRMPVAIISASTTPTGGIRAQMALTQTLLAQAAVVVATLTVPGVKAKVDNGGEIIDAAVRRRAAETLLALNEAAAERRAWLED
jgi:chromate reductase, NAD(P)H dehydrogenase (quinone)